MDSNKDPYFKVGEGALNTHVPGPLATPLTVPVADGVNGQGSLSNGRSGHDSAGGHAHNGSHGKNGAKHG